MKQLYLDGLYRRIKKLELSFCSKEASNRLEKIKLYQRLRSEGCREETALQAIQVSRATYFRWQKSLLEKGPKGLDVASRKPKSPRPKKWTQELQSLVLRFRKENPLYGRLKIQALIKRQFPDFANVSVSTVEES